MNLSLLELYDRTQKNCQFYEQQENAPALLNEIGVLRGIMYCIESAVGEENAVGTIGRIRHSEFLRLIQLQRILREKGE